MAAFNVYRAPVLPIFPGGKTLTYQYRDNMNGMQTLPVNSTVVSDKPVATYRRWGKRILDVTAVLAASVPVGLTIGLLALAVRRDGASAFYVQDRVGKDGKVFRMWKLRSMVADADTVLEDFLASDPAARAEWDHHQKLRDDPRITTLGRIIRKTSLDELPQLWNVLKGEMSLVGPRPMMPSQRVMYPGTEYYDMQPGLTGFWQISDRSETGFHERAIYDRDYLAQMSFVTDLKVLLKTVGVVRRGTGC